MITPELKRHFDRLQRRGAAPCLAMLAVSWITACSSTSADSDASGSSSTSLGGAQAAQGGGSARGSDQGGATTAVSSGGTSAQSQGGSIATGGTSASNSNNRGGTSTGSGGSSARTTTMGGTLSSTGGAPTGTGGRASSGGRPQGGTSAVDASGGTQTVVHAGAGGKSASAGSSARGGTNAQGGVTGNAGGPGGDGTAGGSADYRPCPSNGDACKILPLGDSITYGMQSTDTGGYRVPLFKKVVAASQKITFTGSQKDGQATVSSVAFPRNHEGHSGWTIDQIAGLVPSPAMSSDIPHIVLLMAGTNDVYASSGQATMPDRLGTLLDKVTTAAPNALLVVATLTPLNNASWNTTANTYDGKIPGVVQSRVSKGKHIIMVDMAKMPASGLSSDGVHPNDTGYAYMADVWYAAIRDQLPK